MYSMYETYTYTIFSGKFSEVSKSDAIFFLNINAIIANTE